jgi:hypothetical protein
MNDSTTPTTEDEFEAQVIDRAEEDDRADLGNFRRFTVPMELEVSAGSKAEALTLAMRWRDAIGMPEPLSTDARLDALDFDWHLHHPWGC